MKYYKYIAVVLVYRNVDDLKECIISMKDKIMSLRIIVINAFFDEETMNKIRDISAEYDCDFINIENKGYSYGNNTGIEYAIKHYRYDYIIVSNPDIIVKQFNAPLKEYDIIAPKIIARDGRFQNPMMVRRNRLSEYIIYIGLKRNIKPFLFLGIGINKIERLICTNVTKRNKTVYSIYQAHGSFVIISRRVIETLHPIYDENMFLFAEEGVLALKAKRAGFVPYYCSDLVIYHKEDGSMKLAGTPINSELKKSNVYFYEKYIKQNTHCS